MDKKPMFAKLNLKQKWKETESITNSEESHILALMPHVCNLFSPMERNWL